MDLPCHLHVSSQRSESFDPCSTSSNTTQLTRRSSRPQRFWRKHMVCSTVFKTSLIDKILQGMPSTAEDNNVEKGSCKARQSLLKSHRLKLEKDILKLKERLQEELDLHSALESAIANANEAFPNIPTHLPVDAQELLADIGLLELAVSNLEEQMIEMNVQLRYERKERLKAACKLRESPTDSKENLKQKPPAPDYPEQQTGESPTPFERNLSWSPIAVDKDCQSVHDYSDTTIAVQVLSPSSPSSASFRHPQLPSETRLREDTCKFDRSPDTSTSGSFSSCDECSSMLTNSPIRSSSQRVERIWPLSTPTTPEKDDSYGNLLNDNKDDVWERGSANIPRTVGRGETSNRLVNLRRQYRMAKSLFQKKPPRKLHSSEIKSLWRQPNRLSQEMVSCMIGIYCHLADTSDTPAKHLVSESIPSPNSPFGPVTISSFSSLSESLSLSLTRSPSVDLRNKKDMGSEILFDPYRTRDKLPWAQIGSYSSAVEVSWMSVGKEQLEYAAEALRMFRSLVEQLSKVDAASMRHEEKLAFWINVYNALMMHAYLAYGVPRSDLKFLALMQKAAYTIGGHSFNALTIEHALLKCKAPAYRPQIALLLSLHKVKIPEEANKFAIDRAEPLIMFALSYGACSSPAVRIYTAKNVRAQLQAALHDYLRASVGITAKGKLLVPKLIHTYARDLAEEGAILDWICQSLPWSQASIIQDCFQQRRHRFLSSRNFSVVPFDFRFRYLFLLADNTTTK